MFIIPFIYYKTALSQDSVNMYRFNVLTIGGTQLWAENDSLDPIIDILEPNGIFLEGQPIRYNNFYLCQVDPVKTDLNEFYKWDEIKWDDKELFCWRTFYTFGNQLDICSWLPIPKKESLELESVFKMILAKDNI